MEHLDSFWRRNSKNKLAFFHDTLGITIFLNARNSIEGKSRLTGESTVLCSILDWWMIMVQCGKSQFYIVCFKMPSRVLS